MFPECVGGVRHNGGMSEPELVPRSPLAGHIVVWAFGALAAVAAGVFSPDDALFAWLCVGAGASVFAAFAVNLWYGRSDGFIVRTAASALGAFAAMGIIALAFFVAGLSAAVASV